MCGSWKAGDAGVTRALVSRSAKSVFVVRPSVYINNPLHSPHSLKESALCPEEKYLSSSTVSKLTERTFSRWYGPNPSLSECISQRIGQRIRMKITRSGRSDKGSFVVLIVVPTRVVGHIMTQIHAQTGDGLEVLVLQ